ncbi:MAG: hypothetical protein NT027_18510, partial [Proteobacteria bacterium]|nr:hypothetical protein [Pseudomonadota bacterium]
LLELAEKELPLRSGSIQSTVDPGSSELAVNVTLAKEIFDAKELRVSNSTTKLNELKNQFPSTNLDLTPAQNQLTVLQNYENSLQSALKAKTVLDIASDSTIEVREATVAAIEASKLALQSRLSEKSTSLSGIEDSQIRVSNSRTQLSSTVDAATLSTSELEAILTEFDEDILSLDSKSIESISKALSNSRSYSGDLISLISEAKAARQSHLATIASIESSISLQIKIGVDSLRVVGKKLTDLELKSSNSKTAVEFKSLSAYVNAAIAYLENASGKLKVTLDQQKVLNDAYSKSIQTKEELVSSLYISQKNQEANLNELKSLSTEQKAILNSHKSDVNKVNELLASQRQIISVQSALVQSLKSTKSNVDIKVAEAEKYIQDAESFIIAQKIEIEKIKLQMRIAVDISEKIIRSPESFEEMIKVLQKTPGDYKLGANLNLENYEFDSVLFVNSKLTGNGFKIKNFKIKALTLVSDSIKPNFEDLIIEGISTSIIVANKGVIQNCQFFWVPVNFGSRTFGTGINTSGTGLFIRDSFIRMPSSLSFGSFLKPSVFDSVIETNEMAFKEVKRSYISLLPAQNSLRLDLGDNEGVYVKTGGDTPYLGATLETGTADCQFYHFGQSGSDSRSRIHIPACIRQGQVSLNRLAIPYTESSLAIINKRFPSNRHITESGDLKIVFSNLAEFQVLNLNGSPNIAKLNTQLWFIPDPKLPVIRNSSVFLKSQGLGQAWDLQRHFKFRKHESRADNWGRLNEKWFQADDGKHYFAVPQNAGLFRYIDGDATNFLQKAIFLAHIHPDMISNPEQLFKLWREESIHVISQRLLMDEGVAPIRGRRLLNSSSFDPYQAEAVPMKSRSGRVYHLMKDGDIYVAADPHSGLLTLFTHGTNFLVSRRFALPTPFQYCNPAAGWNIEAYGGLIHPYPYQVSVPADLVNVPADTIEAQLCANIDYAGLGSRVVPFQSISGGGYRISNIGDMTQNNVYGGAVFSNISINNASGRPRCGANCVIENSSLETIQTDILDGVIPRNITIKSTSTKAIVSAIPRSNPLGSWGAAGLIEVFARSENITIENLRVDAKCETGLESVTGTLPINLISFGTQSVSNINSVTFRSIDIYLDCPARTNLKYEPRLFYQPPQLESAKRFNRSSLNIRFDNIRLHLPPAIAATLNNSHWNKSNQILLNDLAKDTFDLKSADLTVISGTSEKKFIYVVSPE